MGCSASVPKSAVVSHLLPVAAKDTVAEDGRRSGDAASSRLCWTDDSVTAEKNSGGVPDSLAQAGRDGAESLSGSKKAETVKQSKPGRVVVEAHIQDTEKRWKHFWKKHQEGQEDSDTTKHGVHFSGSLNLRDDRRNSSTCAGHDNFSSSPSISIARASSLRSTISRDSNAVQRARTRNSYDLSSLPSYVQKPFEPEHGGLAPPPSENALGFGMLESLVELGEHGLHGLRPTVRLLKVESVLRMPQLMSYTHISSSCYVEMPYVDTTDELWAATLVVSWRWHRRLPLNADSGFSPMAPEQLALLKDILCNEGAALQFVWVDFACCPQPSSKQRQLHVTEVMRSKLYYARAARMLALPSIVLLPNENSMSRMLRNASTYLQGAQHLPARKVQIVRTVLHKLQGPAGLQISKRDYFSRAWTLAERLSRAGRGERLQHWMPLSIWMGVLLDLLWVSTQPAGRRKIEAFPWAQFDAEHSPVVCEKLSKVADLYDSYADPELPPDLVPMLLMEGLEVWAAPLPEVDIMNPSWLASYLTAEANVVYVATDWRDTLQALLSFYATDPKAAADPEVAASVLCAFAGVSVQQTQLFKQGLLSGTAANGLRVSMDFGARGGTAVQFVDAPEALRASLRAVEMGEQANCFLLLESSLASCTPGPLSAEQKETLRGMAGEVQVAMRADVGSPRIQSVALRALELLLLAVGESYVEVMEGLGLMEDVLVAINSHSGLDQVVGSAARVLLALCTAPGAKQVDAGPVLLALRCALAANPAAPALQEMLCTCCLRLLQPPPPPDACNWIKLLGDITTTMCTHRRHVALQLLCFRIFRVIVSMPLDGPYERNMLLDGIGRIGSLTDLATSMETHVREPSLQIEAMGCLQALLETAKNREKAGNLGIMSVVAQVLQRNQEAAELAGAGGEVIIAAAPCSAILDQAASLQLIPLLGKKLARWLTRPDVVAPLTLAVAKLTVHQIMKRQAKQVGMVATLQSLIQAYPERVSLGTHARDAIANIIAS